MTESQLKELNIDPIPGKIDFKGQEWETDIIERTFEPFDQGEEIDADQERKVFQDPLFPGISIGHPFAKGGTIGCIVYNKKTGKPCILSNWHVLQGPYGNIGDTIVQPGYYDDNSGNPCGRLLRSHLGVAGDCAICSIEGRKFKKEILGLNIAPTGIGKVKVGDRLVKSGRTTGITHGIVSRMYITEIIDFKGDTGEVEIGGFEIVLDPEFTSEDNEISMKGDSGAGWVFKDKDGKPTKTIAGLHFAGDTESYPVEYALACHIHNVFKKLEITLNAKEAKENHIRKYSKKK